MIEKILRFSLNHPLAILFFTFIVACIGVYSFIRLPIDAVPDITNNQIQINTVLPGYSPEQIEKQITFVVETALAGIPGLEMTRSISRNGFSQVTAIFEDDVDIYFARQQINERLSELRNHLPDSAEVSMGPISTGLGEIYMWTISYKHPNGIGAKIKEGKAGWQKDGSYLTSEGHRLTNDYEKASYLRTVQDWIVRPQLKGVKGVADIDTIGGYVRQYHVEPDIEKVIALGLRFDDILKAIKNNNLGIGPGYVEKNGEAFLIRADEKLENANQINDMVIGEKNGVPIRIKDIAKVGIGKEMRTGSASKDGTEAVIGTAMMLIGANSRIVSQAMEDKLEEVKHALPEDIEITSVLNRTKLVNSTIHTVARNLTEGAILVIVVLLLLLGYFRAACITAMVIPLSMLMTAIGMYQTKISGNLMSLGAIDFGLIVDGAVITIENCMRRLALKQQNLKYVLKDEEKMEEVSSACKEMIQPSVFGQAIIMIVYIPLLTFSGVEGKMFHPMAMTVIFALISAFILSITFIPAMVILFINGRLQDRENPFIFFAKKIYRPLLSQTLQYPWIAIGASCVAVAIAFSLFSKLGEEFIPKLDEKDIAMHAMRIPSTSITQSTDMQLHVERVIKKFPEVAYVYSKTGTAEMASDPMPPSMSDTFIMLKPENQWPNSNLSKAELISNLETALQVLPGNNYEFTQPIEMRFNELISGVRSDVAIKIYGDNFELMQHTAEHISKVLQTISGSADVEVAETMGQPILDIKINRDMASKAGLNASDALQVIGMAMGGEKIGEIFEGDKRFDIIMKLPDHIRENTDALGRIPIPRIVQTREKHFNYLPLKTIASFNYIDGLNEIRRENGKRFVAIQANVRGSDLGTFVSDAKKKIESEVNIPEGYWLAWGGQFENLISARNRLLFVVPVCFILIYMLLFMAFHSFRYASLVFSGVPLALTGGVIALWLREMPFSISAAVGFIALSGIAVLNGLVLISYINQLEKENLALDKAIIQGACTRLRPVLMTALVASLGFIPMAFSSGTGAEVQKPLATVVIGGLVSATILTLFVLPALYKIFSNVTLQKKIKEERVLT